jgi:hypothetical protein
MRRSACRCGVAVALMLRLASADAMAQNALRQACTTDIKAFCGEIQPGEGRLRSCVREHFVQLSEPCKQALLSSVAIVKICQADFQRSCANVEPGGGRIQACLKDHFPEYSESCQKALLLAKLGAR